MLTIATPSTHRCRHYRPSASPSDTSHNEPASYNCAPPLVPLRLRPRMYFHRRTSGTPLLSLPPLPGIIASSDPQQLITDLRTPTPLTFTNTVTGVSGCATDPQTLTAWYTAYVNGVGYTALPTSAIFNVDGQDVYEFFTFPGLTVTALTPGETFSVVWIRSLTHIHSHIALVFGWG